jgi:hypothetical protein
VGEYSGVGVRLSLRPDTMFTCSMYARLPSVQTGDNYGLDLVDATTLLPSGTIFHQPIFPVSNTEWTRLSAIFTTGASGETYLRLVNLSQSQFTVNAGAVLVETGSDLGDYFDASFPGPDYMWEADTSNNPQPAHTVRSHYYQGWRAKQARLDSMVRDSIPFGGNYQILYATPPF